MRRVMDAAAVAGMLAVLVALSPVLALVDLLVDEDPADSYKRPF